MKPHSSGLALVSLGLFAVVLLAMTQPVVAAPPAATPATSGTAAARPHVPVLAYYYIWYTESSWNRAKTDYPALGHYSSDDPEVMRQHIEWAKAAGIDGFIVSWKNTKTLTSRLVQLVQIANQEDFKLVIIYQGLDFNRDPQPATRVADDLDFFAKTFGDQPAFDLFGRPAVIWSGTWEFTPAEIAQVTKPRRTQLLILASERNTADYAKIADLVDGDAYYWSSVNPATYPGYDQKLNDMAKAVHQQGGLWIAPAAPGFDARLVGGTRVVERQEGATLRREFAAAMQSSPDAVGLISWNEFSENSQIEPSCQNGSASLTVVASLLGGTGPGTTGCVQAQSDVVSVLPTPTAVASAIATPVDKAEQQQLANYGFDSSSSTTSNANIPSGSFVLLGAFGIFVIGSFTVVARRARRTGRDGKAS
jgi:hypothetical protein